MSHARAPKGSFHEDWNDLLTRFAQKGTPAALDDQLREAKRTESHSQRPLFDFHQELFNRSQKRGSAA